MRTVINISLPEQMAKTVDKTVKSGKFASKSEFFRHLIRQWQENKFLTELEQSRIEFASGKAKVLKSLKNLR